MFKKIRFGIKLNVSGFEIFLQEKWRILLWLKDKNIFVLYQLINQIDGIIF